MIKYWIPVAVYSSEKNVRLCNCLQLIVDVSAFGFSHHLLSLTTQISPHYILTRVCIYLSTQKKTDRCYRKVSATEETCDVYNLFVMNSNICVCYYFTFVVICTILSESFLSYRVVKHLLSKRSFPTVSK